MSEPSPLTGASTSAFPSSFLSSSRSRSSFPKHVIFLGGVLGAAGAYLYSLSRCDGNDAEKTSKVKASIPFFNRVEEETKLKAKLNDGPGAITVLVGPPNYGKTRYLKEMSGQYNADQTTPPFLYINGRWTPVSTPGEVVNVLTPEQVRRSTRNLGLDGLKWLLSPLKSINKSVEGSSFNGTLEGNLETELKKAKALLSMVESNLLALRPGSPLARDLLKEVHGDLLAPVVTLKSPSDHVCAGKESLLERKNAESADASASTASADASVDAPDPSTGLRNSDSSLESQNKSEKPREKVFTKRDVQETAVLFFSLGAFLTWWLYFVWCWIF